MEKGFDQGKNRISLFLHSLQILFHVSPDFPLPGVGRSQAGYWPHLVFCVFKTLTQPWSITQIIIWLVPRAGKMNQIARCDWLPERARWSHLARSGLPAVSRKQNFPKSLIINPLLTKFVRSRWLDIGLVLFLRVYGPRLRLGP